MYLYIYTYIYISILQHLLPWICNLWTSLLLNMTLMVKLRLKCYVFDLHWSRHWATFRASYCAPKAIFVKTEWPPLFLSRNKEFKIFFFTYFYTYLGWYYFNSLSNDITMEKAIPLHIGFSVFEVEMLYLYVLSLNFGQPTSLSFTYFPILCNQF